MFFFFHRFKNTIERRRTDTIRQIKKSIRQKKGIRADARLALIFAGQELDNDEGTVGSYGISRGLQAYSKWAMERLLEGYHYTSIWDNFKRTAGRTARVISECE
jgi:Ubiquitin family.